MTDDSQSFVIFDLDRQRYAMPLAAVRQVVRAVQVAPLPGAPDWLLGVIDVHGVIVELVSMRRLHGRIEREIILSDQLILISVGDRTVALLVDAVLGVRSVADAVIVQADRSLPGAGTDQAIIKDSEGIIIICQPQHLLAPLNSGQVARR